jgi:flagellar hook protein FlgE
MSINSALLAGVSGLVANSSALAAISDNIANVNTVAYKRNQVNFANVVTAQSVTGRYSAGGVQGITRQFVSQQGLIQASGSATDLAINGDGFFIVSSKGAGLTAADPRSFTRAGSFSVDAAGYLVNDSKLYLQGWPVQSNGSFNISPSDLNLLQPINVKGLGAAVAPTANVGIAANFDKNATAPVPPVTFNVVDESGQTHSVAMTLTKTATPNQWTATLTSPDVTPGPIATGNVVFNSDGTLNAASTTLVGATATTINWNASFGVSAQPVAFNLSKLTQYADVSSVDSTTQDGAGPGNVMSVQVDEAGIVSAIYDNGQVRTLAKVAVATFPNSDGLKRAAGNAYHSTLSAGEMTIKQAGDGGAGAISPSSLESSTVDLSSEFTGLITTQKAYSASSKIITTADQMLDELINIIR